ncbi:MAG: DUF4274 domain-containing protein [Zoogloeaceae bacterium]|jgi:hypothetical protein|nr:DUF4274 domain-containing protein [Zoogloeaceae bacterium]
MKQISEQEWIQMKNAVWDEFLTHATQAEIFFSVGSSNWDDNAYLLNWILEHPELDKAIPLRAYWMSVPDFMKLKFASRAEAEAVGWILESFDFVETLEQKYVAGFWKESRIRFDPDEEDWTKGAIANASRLKRPIPKLMFQRLEGEEAKVPEDFDEGLPLALAQRLYDLLDEYEVV